MGVGKQSSERSHQNVDVREQLPFVSMTIDGEMSGRRKQDGVSMTTLFEVNSYKNLYILYNDNNTIIIHFRFKQIKIASPKGAFQQVSVKIKLR